MENTFNDEIGELLFQIHRLYHIRMSEVVKALEISPRQIPILKHLYRFCTMNQRELAEKIGISTASIALMLKKMEDNGLIEKKTVPTDRRYYSVSLTEKGKATVEQLRTIRKSLDVITVSGFSEEEKTLLRSLLLSVRSNLKKDTLVND